MINTTTTTKTTPIRTGFQGYRTASSATSSRSFPQATPSGLAAFCKAWFLAWASDPVLDFNDQENSVNFVDDTLTRLNDNVLVQKFKLYQRFYVQALDRMEHWLAFVTERNVKELDIDAVTNDMPYTLSQSVFHANSLTVLKLANMKLNVPKFVTLKSLKILLLKYVNLDDESAHNMISSCSSLEKLDLWVCFGLKRLRISNSNLMALEIGHCMCSRIAIEAGNLDTFFFAGHWIVDFGNNGTLANLSILRLCLLGKAKPLRDQISELPRLEKLEIRWGRGARNFMVCNKSLKHLVLVSLVQRVDVVVDAPNLISLEYDKFLISITSLNAPKLSST